MERPAYLREDLYRLVIDSAKKFETDKLYQKLLSCGYAFEGAEDTLNFESLIGIVLDSPSPYLYQELHILSKPDLLLNLFIEFEDDELDAGLTYLIDREAAEEIAANDSTIMLREGKEGRLMPRARIEEAFKNGCRIDYLTANT